MMWRAVLALVFGLWVWTGAACAFDEAVIGAADHAAAGFRQDLDQLNAELVNPSISDAQLADHRDNLESVRARALGQINALEGPIDEINQQLNQLGSPPKEGQTEAQAVAAQRKLLGDMLNRLLGVKAQLDLAAVEADQTAGRVGAIQRDRFVKRVFEPGKSILNPVLWIDSSVGLGLFLQRAGGLLAAWWREVAGAATFTWLIMPPLFFAAVALLRRTIRRRLTQSFPSLAAASEAPTDLDRLWRVFTSAGGVFLLLLMGVILPVSVALEQGGFLTARFEALFDALAFTILPVAVFYAFVRRLTSPGKPDWRIVDLDDRAASRVTLLSTTAVAVSSGAAKLSALADTLFLPVNYTVGLTAISAVALIVLTGLVLITLGSQQGLGERLGQHATYLKWLRSLSPLYWLLLAVAALALLAGYVALGNFIAGQIVETSILVAVLLLLHRLADAAVRASIDPMTKFGQSLRRLSGFGERGIERLGLGFRTVTDVLLVAAGLPLLFLQWTVTWVDFRSLFNSVAFGFKIGSFTISPWSALLVALVLLLGIGLTRLAISWLDRRILAETRIDKGVQDSVKKGASYAGYTVAALFALSAAGLEFSNLAIVAGALGVGIGFGLQSIVNNFVSGLILLAERPIRIGDWVSLAAGEGLVKRINVRATVIETFDNCSIIVPNSQLISEPVKNWTHDDTLGRFLVSVTTVFDADAEKARDILTGIARAHPKVLTFPEPQVTLSRFTPLGAEYELRANVADVFEAVFVASDIRFAILKDFQEAGIAMPQPQKVQVTP